MYVVFADTIYRSMIYKKCYKLVQSDMGCRHSVISKLTVFNFINHIFNFLLRRIVAHSSHQVRKLVDGNLFIVKLSSFCCIFFLSPNYAIVKEIIHILECLSFSTTFNQINKRLDSFTTNCDGLFNWSNIDVPHMFTARSSPPHVNMYFPSAVQQMSVTSFGCAISPIVLFGLPSEGNLSTYNLFVWTDKPKT
jgi:hypothetical protein